MKPETFSGTIETAFGNKLPAALPFTGKFDAYETPAEIREKGDWPSESDIVKMVNTDRKMSARAAATAAALEAKFKETGNPIYKKLDANTPEGQREALVKSTMKENPKLSR